MLFDGSLRPDSSVICARQPKDFKALHSRATTENVLNGVVQNVAKREHAGDVRRRHHY